MAATVSIRPFKKLPVLGTNAAPTEDSKAIIRATYATSLGLAQYESGSVRCAHLSLASRVVCSPLARSVGIGSSCRACSIGRVPCAGDHVVLWGKLWDAASTWP